LGLTKSYSTFIVPLDVRMKSLKFTKETSTIALVFFTVYFVYGLFYTPTIQYLVSLLVGGIAFAMTESYEIAVIALLVINYIFPVFRGSSMKDVTAYNIPQMPMHTHEGFATGNPEAVRKTIESITGMPGLNVTGVASEMTEGFADASEAAKDDDLTSTKKVDKPIPTKKDSASAPVSVLEDDKAIQLEKMTEMMTTVMKTMNKKAPSASTKEEDAFEDKKVEKLSDKPAVHQPAESFADKNGLFKLGQIPTEAKGGFHIDAGTTVMNAINALKPDQIKSMTADTKQLIDTQKSLMSMLQTFQPMVQEGKQMMDTFQTMFAPTAGAAQ